MGTPLFCLLVLLCHKMEAFWVEKRLYGCWLFFLPSVPTSCRWQYILTASEFRCTLMDSKETFYLKYKNLISTFKTWSKINVFAIEKFSLNKVCVCFLYRCSFSVQHTGSKKPCSIDWPRCIRWGDGGISHLKKTYIFLTFVVFIGSSAPNLFIWIRILCRD